MSSERRFLPGTSIELVSDDIPVGHIKYALFDFDGTISLLRQGWQDVMIPMMCDLLEEVSPDEPKARLRAQVKGFVDELTGKQTIFQMIEFCNQMRARGAKPEDPTYYKQMYLDLLWQKIRDRVDGVKSGTISQESMMVPGARAMLEALYERGIKMYVASGTDQPFVRDEVTALGVAPFFAGIYGATDNEKNLTADKVVDIKSLVIERIIKENNMRGVELLGCGDGFVEIQRTKEVGGIAIGAAVDELGRVNVDEWKRERLIGVGADLIIPHFVPHEPLIEFLFPG